MTTSHVLPPGTPFARTDQREPWSGVTRPVRLKGFLWSAAVPLGWMLLSLAFLVHARFSLGRWPYYEDVYSTGPLFVHHQVTEWLARALFISLYAVPLALAVCLGFRRWRHISLYLLCYGAAVSVAFAAALLAGYDCLGWILN